MIKNLLVSYGEKATNRLLDNIFLGTNYKISRKVRLADVFDIDEKRWLSEERSFMLKSHFDFIITKYETMKPLFAIEFDGEYHNDPKQIRRDNLKEAICQKSDFPVCRFTNDDIKFKWGIQPAIDKLLKVTEIFTTVHNAFIKQLNKKQLQILIQFAEWQMYDSPWKTLNLPSFTDLAKKLNLNRSSIFILNSLKYGIYYFMARNECEEKNIPSSTENTVNATLKLIGESNDIDLQEFTIAILLEEWLKGKPKDVSTEEYIKKNGPGDPSQAFNVWQKFLVN